MHTILGANGVIGHELSKALVKSTRAIRQVSRHPTLENPSDELFTADLLDAEATSRAVEGSEVAYLVVGLKYDTGVWREQWPVIMRNVIAACKRHRARLVFFDNVYAYGLVDGVMTEETPFRPTSQKGEVRAQIASNLLDEMKAGNIEAMIVRAADFYGPKAVLSFTDATVFSRILAGKTPQWMGNPDAIHTFTFTPDAGRAVALLGQAGEAYGETWHLPTTKEALTAREFVKLACELAGQPFKMQVAPRWAMKLMGLFMPIIRESQEMMYQFDHDYRFDSTKFEKAFGVTPTPYRAGIADCLKVPPTP